MTVLVFTFILLLGESLKEVFTLLVNGQVGVVLVMRAVVLLIPFVLVFALPMGLLTAMLLVFGRFSADQELTAARACGISLVSLVTPLLLLGAACAGLSAWITMKVAPECRIAYKKLIYDVGTSQASSLLTERTFIRDLPGCILYAGSVEGLRMRDVLLYQLDAAGHKKSYLRANEARVEIDMTNRVVSLTMLDGWELVSDFGSQPAWHRFGELQLPPFQLPSELGEKAKLSNMTWHQLWGELRALESQMRDASAVGKLTSAELQERLRAVASASDRILEPVRIQIHRQAAFPMACIGFTLVGIPLGIRAHRRETSVGFAIALLLVALYYSFFILAQALETRPQLHPHLMFWVPNFLFQAVGAVMLWRANRGV
jgi:lipopolysaccharide export system permease protein